MLSVKECSLLLVVCIMASHLAAAQDDQKLQCADTFGVGLFPCSGDICVAERVMFEGDDPFTDKFCLDKGLNPHWRDLCSGLNDTETNVYQCCLEDLCNSKLHPRLGTEAEVPTEIIPYRPNITLTTTGLKCRFGASDKPSNGHPGFCHGPKCFLHIYQSEGVTIERRGCITAVHNETVLCSGSQNSRTSAYECCAQPDMCNLYLTLKLPIEDTTKPTPEDPLVTTAHPSYTIDSFNLILGVILSIGTLTIFFSVLITVIGIIIVKYRRKKISGKFRQATSHIIRIDSSSSSSSNESQHIDHSNAV